MKKHLIPVLFTSTVLLSGCLEDKQKETDNDRSAVVSREDAVAVVNGTYISKETLQNLEKEIAQRSRGQKFPKKQLIEELVQRQLLVQDAKQKHLDKSPEVKARLATVENSLLSQADIQDYLKSHPITDEEIKAQYDATVGKAGVEFKARHILVKTQDEAKKLIEQLSNGADFVVLAKSKSTGPSGPQGGDLGWFTADRMVAPFSEAVMALQNGEFTKEPIKTQFGWHVILRENSRKQTPPPFEAIKEQIRPMLQRKAVQAMMENLRKQAKVEILVPLTDQPKPAEPKPELSNEKTELKQNATQQKAEDTSESIKDKAKEVVKIVVDNVKDAAENSEMADENSKP